MKTLGGISIVGILLAIILIQGQAFANDMCKDYAETAVKQNQDNINWGCGYKSPAWNSTYNHHFNWCIGGVSSSKLQSETKARDDMLKTCSNEQTSRVHRAPPAPDEPSVHRAPPAPDEPSVHRAPPAVEENTDRPGMDYKKFLVEEDLWHLCEMTCLPDPQCKAWTYVKPVKKGDKGICWLKSGVPEAKSASCCISGVKPEDMIPSSKGVFSWHYTNTQQTCKELCLTNGKIPVAAGKYTNGEDFYVCATHKPQVTKVVSFSKKPITASGDNLPKVEWKPWMGNRIGLNLEPSWSRICQVGFNDKQMAVKKYHCLCSKKDYEQYINKSWYPAKNQTCPEVCLENGKHPVAGGDDMNNHPYHVCRVTELIELDEEIGGAIAGAVYGATLYYSGSVGFNIIGSDWTKKCIVGMGGRSVHADKYDCLCADEKIKVQFQIKRGGIEVQYY